MPDDFDLSVLPNPIAAVVSPVFDVLPPSQALGRLVVDSPLDHPEAIDAVAAATSDPAIADQPPLAAGLWLYVDELDRSHRISQSIHNATGSYWHAIMHRLEGDFGNSHYWLRQTGHHPAMDQGADGYDAGQLVDDSHEAYRSKQLPEDLIALQRAEWWTLFRWCAD